MPQLWEDDDLHQSQPTTSRSRSRRQPPVLTVVNQLQLEVSVMSSN